MVGLLDFSGNGKIFRPYPLLRANGMPANLEDGAYSRDAPIKNFTSNIWQEMAEKYLPHSDACACCPIA